MADVPTIVGSFPSAPASAETPVVLLWVVSGLVVLFGTVCFLLWQRIQNEAAKCREENAEARKDAKDAREKIEDLYMQAALQSADRETKLIAVVASNTQALNEIKEIGSGYYRTLREQHERRAHPDG